MIFALWQYFLLRRFRAVEGKLSCCFTHAYVVEVQVWRWWVTQNPWFKNHPNLAVAATRKWAASQCPNYTYPFPTQTVVGDGIHWAGFPAAGGWEAKQEREGKVSSWALAAGCRWMGLSHALNHTQAKVPVPGSLERAPHSSGQRACTDGARPTVPWKWTLELPWGVFHNAAAFLLHWE